MKLNAKFISKDPQLYIEPCTVTKIIELPKTTYDYFKNNMLDEHYFINENIDLMGYGSEDDGRRCILVLCEGENDGVLVDSQGYGYARYTSFLPNARQLAILDQSSEMTDFIQKMKNLADTIVAEVMVEHENGIHSISEEHIEDLADSDCVSFALPNRMLAERPEFKSVDNDLQEYTFELKEEYLSQIHYKELSQEDVEIKIAKHILWLNNHEDGEQADFNKCLIKGIDLSHKNLLNAHLDGAKFENTKFTDVSLCFSTANGTQFVNCDMTGTTAEECNFIGAKFKFCKLDGVYFTHSDFRDAEFERSSMEKGSIKFCNFDNARTEGLSLVNCQEGGEYNASYESQTPTMEM